jgi:hypothetical protein
MSDFPSAGVRISSFSIYTEDLSMNIDNNNQSPIEKEQPTKNSNPIKHTLLTLGTIAWIGLAFLVFKTMSLIASQGGGPLSVVIAIVFGWSYMKASLLLARNFCRANVAQGARIGFLCMTAGPLLHLAIR